MTTVHLEIVMLILIWHYSHYIEMCKIKSSQQYLAELLFLQNKNVIKNDSVVPAEIIAFKGLKSPQTPTLGSCENLQCY